MPPLQSLPVRAEGLGRVERETLKVARIRTSGCAPRRLSNASSAHRFVGMARPVPCAPTARRRPRRDRLGHRAGSPHPCRRFSIGESGSRVRLLYTRHRSGCPCRGTSSAGYRALSSNRLIDSGGTKKRPREQSRGQRSRRRGCWKTCGRMLSERCSSVPSLMPKARRQGNSNTMARWRTALSS